MTINIKGQEVIINDCERTVCEQWDRVMGYFRIVEDFNIGKKQEQKERKRYKESTIYPNIN